MNGKLKRDLSTKENQEWWASVAEAAKRAPKLRFHEGDLDRIRKRQEQLAAKQGRS